MTQQVGDVMTRILVLFGTTDGHTAKIARRLGDALRRHDADADIVDLSRAQPLPVGYDGVIVAASVHEGKYQRHVQRWVRTYAPTLSSMPSAFLSVCLGVLQPQPEVQDEVQATIRRFLTSVGWEPAVTRTLAGAVPYTRYGWLKRRIMKRIVGKAGGGTDTTRDYEYTDWEDVERFAAAFAGQVATSVGETAAPAYAQSA